MKLITDKPRIKPQLNQVALALKAFSGIRGDSKPIAAQPPQAKSGKWDQFNLQITPTGTFSWDTTSFWRKSVMFAVYVARVQVKDDHLANGGKLPYLLLNGSKYGIKVRI